MNMMTPHAARLDYFPCHYGNSKLLFRGPQRRLRGPYTACLGSSETFGRFIEKPYPDLLEDATGRPCVNLGCREAGVEAFLASPGLVDIAAKARVTVIEVMGAIYMSNRFYTVDPRRNHRFIRASRRLKALYPEVDFRGFDRVDDMLRELACTCIDRLQTLRREIQTAWVARMRTLVGQLGNRVILLWLADHAPYSPQKGGTICRSPVFVDRAMLDAVCREGAELVEVVATGEDIAAGLAGMIHGPLEEDSALRQLGPLVHRRAADAVVRRLSLGD